MKEMMAWREIYSKPDLLWNRNTPRNGKKSESKDSRGGGKVEEKEEEEGCVSGVRLPYCKCHCALMKAIARGFRHRHDLRSRAAPSPPPTPTPALYPTPPCPGFWVREKGWERERGKQTNGLKAETGTNWAWARRTDRQTDRESNKQTDRVTDIICENHRSVVPLTRRWKKNQEKLFKRRKDKEREERKNNTHSTVIIASFCRQINCLDVDTSH